MYEAFSVTKLLRRKGGPSWTPPKPRRSNRTTFKPDHVAVTHASVRGSRRAVRLEGLLFGWVNQLPEDGVASGFKSPIWRTSPRNSGNEVYILNSLAKGQLV